MVGSHRLVELIWGYLGEYFGISVMSAACGGVRMTVSGSFVKLCRSWGDGKKIVAILDLSQINNEQVPGANGDTT